jgi:hypothetical protein
MGGGFLERERVGKHPSDQPDGENDKKIEQRKNQPCLKVADLFGNLLPTLPEISELVLQVDILLIWKSRPLDFLSTTVCASARNQ